MKNPAPSNAFLMVCLAVLTFSVAAWIGSGINRDLKELQGRTRELGALMPLRDDLFSADTDENRMDAAAVISQSFGADTNVDSREEMSRDGWTLFHHRVEAGDVAPSSLDTFFRLCGSASPRLLIEEMEVSAAADHRLSVRLLVAELVKN